MSKTSKTLFLFLQSKNPDTYVNVLTCCVKQEEVKEIYFIGDQEVVSREFEVEELIENIRTKLDSLKQRYPDYYQEVYELLPTSSLLKNRVLRFSYTKPLNDILNLKRTLIKTNNYIVDITACSKHLSIDIISLFLAYDINNVSYFELSDKVYSDEWKALGKEKLFHNLKGSIDYYKYVSFSKSPAVAKGMNKIRSQGRLVKSLLILSVVLVCITFSLLHNKQFTFAQIAIGINVVALAFGLAEDSFSLSERLRR